MVLLLPPPGENFSARSVLSALISLKSGPDLMTLRAKLETEERADVLCESGKELSLGFWVIVAGRCEVCVCSLVARTWRSKVDVDDIRMPLLGSDSSAHRFVEGVGPLIGGVSSGENVPSSAHCSTYGHVCECAGTSEEARWVVTVRVRSCACVDCIDGGETHYISRHSM